MAFLGFGKSDDEYYQPQQESSFLGNIGSMLWTGVKAAFYAALAVVTLGTIFTVSDGAKDFADKYAFGMGSKIKGWMDKGVDTVKDFLSPEKPLSPATDTPTEQIKNGLKILHPNSLIITSEITTAPEKFSQLSNVLESSANLATRSVDQDRANKESVLRQMRVGMQFGQSIEVWNNAASGPAAKEQSDRGAPIPPVISLNVPAIPDSLAEIGASKHKDVWAKASPLQQIEMLQQTIGLYNKDEELPKFIKGKANKYFNHDYGPEGSVKNIGDLVPLHDAAGTTFGKWSKIDESWSKAAQNAIANLITENRMSEAAIASQGAIEYMNKLGKNLEATEKEKGSYYVKSIEELQKMQVFATDKHNQQLLAPILVETYKNIQETARNTPIIVNQYETQVASYRKNVELAAALQNGSSTATGATTIPQPARDTQGISQGQAR